MSEVNNLGKEENVNEKVLTPEELEGFLIKIESKSSLLITGAKIHDGNDRGLDPSELNTLLDAIVFRGKFSKLYALAEENGLFNAELNKSS